MSLAMGENFTHHQEMSKSVRIPDELHALATWVAKAEDRGIAEQLRHWIKLGIAAETKRVPLSDVDVEVALGGRLDIMDVATGKRSQESLLLISRERARQSKPTFPAKYKAR